MSDSSQATLIWKQAIKRYEEITKKQLDNSALKNLKTVDDLLQEIDSENQSFSDFRRKRHDIFGAMTFALRPIELIGDMAAGGASMAFPPSSLVFGAVQFLINAAKGVSAKYDAIIELMSTLKDFTIRLETYTQQQISQRLRDKLADILTTLIEIFAITRREIQHGRLLSFGKNILLSNDDGKTAIVKLANLIDSEKGLVGAETLTEIKGANVALTRVDYNVIELTRRIENMALTQEQAAVQVEEAKEQRQQDHVKKVLQPGTKADDKYSMINRSRVPKTGNWIRDEQDFRNWMNRTKPILWVSGTPGAGKSYIASNIISYLKQSFPQNVQHPSHVSVGYFFFKDDDPKTRSFYRALSDIAFKIAQNDPAYAKHVMSCVDSPDDVATLQSLWQKLFLDFFIEDDRCDSSVYIILDALDEAFAEDRLEFFDLAKEIQQGGRFQLLMTGRPHIAEEMDDVMEMLNISTIYVSALNNSDDIVHYIKSSIAKSAYLKRASKTLQAEIVEKLSVGAQGMFIWVDFMLKELLKKKDERSMRKALNEAPNGLSRMIRHVLKGFSESLKETPEYADDLNEMLAWATCAQRPLKLVEMDNVLKWRYPEGEGWVWIEGSLRRQFASFFLLTREDRLTTADLQRTASFDGGFVTESPSDSPQDGFYDAENVLDFNSDPLTTEVTFNHASIGDFFRNEREGKVSSDDGCPAVGVNYHDAKVLVLRRCLEVICCEENSPKSAIALALRPYALESVVAGLKAIDITRTSTPNKRVIGLLIAQLLSKQSVIAIFGGSIGYGLFCKENLDLFNKWLGDEDIHESLPPEESTWYDEATGLNSANIFLRLIEYHATQWLQGLYWNGNVCCNVVFHFLNLRDGHPFLLLDSPEKVLETAEWCGFEKNALWHRRLAITLRDLDYHDRALEYFEKALELDPDMWLALAGMSLTFIAIKNYAKAIELDKLTVERLESKTQTSEVKGGLHSTYERLGDCYDILEDDENGLAMYQKGLEHSNRCDNCIYSVLAYFHELERYDETIAMLQSMDEKIPDKEYTRLTESLLANNGIFDGYFGWLSAAGYYNKNKTFILHAYAAAVATAHRERKVVQAANLELCLGVLYQAYGHDPEGAARIWERLINTYRGSKAEDDIKAVLEYASIQLANHYLTRCMEIGVETTEGEKCGQKLELLAIGKVPNLNGVNPSPTDSDKDETIHFVTNSTIGLIVANFYKACGKEHEAVAWYKAQVKECIRLLSDDDPTNDWEAYLRLAGVLTATKDDENAIGLFYQINMEAEKETNEEESESEEDKNNTEGDCNTDGKEVEEDRQNNTHGSRSTEDITPLLCNGCMKSIRVEGISICRYCLDVQFCETCIQLRKNGTLPANVCSQKHEWIVIPPRPQRERKRNKEQKEMLFIQDHWVTLEEFKDRLREKWGITDKM